MNEEIYILDDNKEYKLIKKIFFNNIEYMFLVDKDKYNIYVIAEYKNGMISVVENKKILSKLVLELYKTNNYKE